MVLRELEPLIWLADYIHELPVLLLASFRPEDTPTLIEDLPGMEVIMLGRLKHDDIVALSISMLGRGGSNEGVLRMLEQETEGNALFIIEVMRALAEDTGSLDKIGTGTLPHNVMLGGLEQVITRRMTHIPADVQALLRLAAVAGRWINLRVLHYLAREVNIDEWVHICINVGVVDGIDGRYRFAHDKLRSAVLMSIPGAGFCQKCTAKWLQPSSLLTPTMTGLRSSSSITGTRLAIFKKEAHMPAQQHSWDEPLPRGQFHYERALELTDDDVQQVALNKRLGDVEERIGNFQAAIAYYERCLKRVSARSTHQEALRILADAFIGLGNIAIRQSKYVTADRFIGRGNQLHTSLGNRPGMASSLLTLGISAYHQGKYADAKAYTLQSLDIYSALDSLIDAANALDNLGYIAYLQGDYFTAQEHYRQSMLMWQSVGDRWGIANTLYHLGNVAFLLEDIKSARQYHEESHTIRKEIGDKWGVAASLVSLGGIAHAAGDDDGALTYYQQSLALRRDLADRQGAVNVLLNLATLMFEWDVPELRAQAFARSTQDFPRDG